MAISIDANSPQNSGAQSGASASFNFTITNGFANCVLYVFITISDSGSPNTVTACSYNGTPCTLRTNSDPALGAGLLTYIYRLINPTADGAAHSISVTLSGAPSSGWCVGAIAFGGDNTVTPEDQYGSNQASSAVTTLSVSLNTTTDNDYYIVCGVDQGGFTTLALGDSATQQYKVTGTAEHICGTKSLGTHGTITPTITVGQGGSALAMSAVAIQPLTGATSADIAASSSVSASGNLGQSGYITLEDGTSKILLEDGSGALILEQTGAGGAISAGISASSTVTASLTGTGAVASVINSSASATANLQGIAPVASVINAGASSTENLTGTGALASVVNSTSTLTGALAGTGALASVISSTSIVTANLTTSGSTGALVAAISSSSSVTALLTGNGTLASAVSASSTVLGTLAGTGSLGATILAAAAAAGTLTATGALAAIINGLSFVSATPVGPAPPATFGPSKMRLGLQFRAFR